MSEKDKAIINGVAKVTTDVEWQSIDSNFRLVLIAALRNKQLVKGAIPRIAADPRKNRHTSIALEEARQGLVPFTYKHEDLDGNITRSRVKSE